MSTRLLPFALAFAGCVTAKGPGPDSGAQDTSIPVVIGDGDDTGDTGPDSGPDDATFQATFFSNAVVHEVVITLTDDAWQSLSTDPYGFATGNVTFDDELVKDSGVRLRGKVGSFRSIDQKPKFKFDFGEYKDGQDFHGLKALALNNEVVDCSYLKEPIAYRVFRDAGVPAPRTSFAHVTVNGEDYGLYVVVEVPDGKFLTDRYPGDDQGQLYDGKYKYYSDGTYTMLDFAIGVDDLFQLEEGVDEGNAHVVAISDGIGAASTSFQADMSALVDWDEVHREIAVEQWIGHVDGYALNRNNYRVYFRQSDGKLQIIPWDFDYAFIHDYEWGMSWDTPAGSLMRYCWRDADCLASQSAAVSEVLASVDTDALLADYDAMADLTQELAHDDPKRECNAASVRAQRASVRTWIEGQSAALQADWGL